MPLCSCSRCWQQRDVFSRQTMCRLYLVLTILLNYSSAQTAPRQLVDKCRYSPRPRSFLQLPRGHAVRWQFLLGCLRRICLLSRQDQVADSLKAVTCSCSDSLLIRDELLALSRPLFIVVRTQEKLGVPSPVRTDSAAGLRDSWEAVSLYADPSFLDERLLVEVRPSYTLFLGRKTRPSNSNALATKSGVCGAVNPYYAGGRAASLQ